VFSDLPETQIQTKYGTACGRPYPLSDRFLGDMQQLAQSDSSYVCSCSGAIRTSTSKGSPQSRILMSTPCRAI
jgi:hypothetical protein